MSRTALLLMDLQGNTLAHTTDDYLPRAVRALATARAAGVPVIHVALRLRDGHTDAHPRLSDACADRDPALHDAVITGVLSRRSEVATVDEWKQALSIA